MHTRNTQAHRVSLSRRIFGARKCFCYYARAFDAVMAAFAADRAAARIILGGDLPAQHCAHALAARRAAVAAMEQRGRWVNSLVKVRWHQQQAMCWSAGCTRCCGWATGFASQAMRRCTA